MRIKTVVTLLLVFGISVGFSSTAFAQEDNIIPPWIKGVANWWAQGNISDDEFLDAMQFLINDGYIPIDEPEHTHEKDIILEEEEYYYPEEREIIQIGDEYWRCYSDESVSSDCLPYDEKYFVGIDDLVMISGYNVVCDPDCELSLDIHYDDVDKKLEKFTSEKLHQEIFDAYVSVTPQVILDELVYFSITTDDYYGNEAAVTFRDAENPLKMELSVDPIDAAPNGKIDKQFFTTLMIHENAHMISLSASQSNNDMINPETNEEMRVLMKEKQAICDPNYYNDVAGCMNDNSYLNLFFQEFWTSVYPDYKWEFEFDIDEEFYAYEDAFIEKYEDQFIGTYAMSYVDEDFAESFTAFVLWEEPTGDTIPEQKILFFYDFEELLEIRDFIRSTL